VVSGVTRRALVAGAGAALLAGCGEGDDPPPERAAEARGGDSTLADLALLNDALGVERRTAGVLPRATEHVATLERAIRARRGTPRPLEGGEPPGGARAAANELIAFYVDLLTKLSEPELRGLVAGLLADAGAALANERRKAGDDPAPSAFVAGVPPGER
jgi:hypothetical protein